MRTRAEVRRLCPLLLAASLLGGCAISPGNGRSPAVYDFGLPSARNGGEGEWPRIALEVVAPPWFDALNVDYRLAYDDPLKQRDTKGLFQQANLPADGLGREVKLLTRTHDAASLGHHPEIVQLSVIEHGNHHFVKIEVYARKIRIFLNCCLA